MTLLETLNALQTELITTTYIPPFTLKPGESDIEADDARSQLLAQFRLTIRRNATDVLQARQLCTYGLAVLDAIDNFGAEP